MANKLSAKGTGRCIPCLYDTTGISMSKIRVGNGHTVLEAGHESWDCVISRIPPNKSSVTGVLENTEY